VPGRAASPQSRYSFPSDKVPPTALIQLNVR
jgi:hypothetical protein